MTPLSPADRCFIDKFCYQCLQLCAPDYPDPRLMKHAEVQDEIFDRVCERACSVAPNIKFQLRVLKKLALIIEAGISDAEDSDEYVSCWPLSMIMYSLGLRHCADVDQEVSDRIMERVGDLISMPQVPDTEAVQMKCQVTYRLSLLQPPAFIDIFEKQGLIAAAGTTGLRTWEAALHLGQYLCHQRSLVAEKRVLELGAGTGYLSIVCAKCLDAAHVTASDGSEEVVDNLSENFVLNDLKWSYDPTSNATISPKLLKWGHALLGTEEPEWNGGEKIDLVLGADITYDHRAIAALMSTLDELFSLNPHTVVLIAATERNPETLGVFQEACARNRLVVEEINDFTVNCDDDDDHKCIATPFYQASNPPIRIYQITSGYITT